MCTNCTPTIDEATSSEFGERMLDLVNSASIAMMISIGHRTGLFDAMEDGESVTSQQLADRSGLNERYVREWLGAMVVGRIIEYSPGDRIYRLPLEHAAVLTRSASPNNVAPTMQWFAVFGQVEDDIVRCFYEGGGVPYTAFTRFHDVMAEESAQTVVAALHDHILPLVHEVIDDLNRGIEVLDIGCGAGRAMCALAEAFPSSRFTGYDFSEEAIGKARALAEKRQLGNVTFDVRDVADIGEESLYDLVTAFDAIHDQRDPDQVLDKIRAALKPDGTLFMQDIRASSQLENNMDHPIVLQLR